MIIYIMISYVVKPLNFESFSFKGRFLSFNKFLRNFYLQINGTIHQNPLIKPFIINTSMLRSTTKNKLLFINCNICEFLNKFVETPWQRSTMGMQVPVSHKQWMYIKFRHPSFQVTGVCFSLQGRVWLYLSLRSKPDHVIITHTSAFENNTKLLGQLNKMG